MLSSVIAQPIIRSPTGRLDESTNASRHIYVALFMLVPENGVLGLLLLSFGTTPAPTLLLDELHLKHYMVTRLACFLLLWAPQLMKRLFSGFLVVTGWTSSFNIISIEPSSV